MAGKNPSKSNPKNFWIKKFVKMIQPELEISSIDFAVFSEQQIKSLSQVEIFVPEIYDSSPERNFNKSGPLDLRLGTSLKSHNCATCGMDLAECIGHFGHITLPLPVYHIGYFNDVQRIYQSICKTCAKLLLTPQQKKYFRAKLKIVIELGKTETRSLVKDISMKICSKVKHCYYCGASNGKVLKGVNFYGLLHRRFNESRKKLEDRKFLEEFETVLKHNPELEKYVSQSQETPNALTVRNLFKNIPNEDLFFLNLRNTRPEDLIMTVLLVPPACIRPTVQVDDSTSQEDDLTGKLREIIKISNTIKENMNKGGITSTLRGLWVLLQSEVARYINSDMTGFPKSGAQQKQMRSLMQRLIGKQGRFRGNLSGKRVDFSGRTVISPDPNVEIDQVVIPRKIAQILTYPETVNKHNIKTLKKCVINGPDKYPGANFVLVKKDNIKKFLKYGDRVTTAKNLKLGDCVERHLLDRDIVLFNRQPSLHRMSIMAHRAVIMDWRTLRFNLCVCNPYNADFDGDEMNIHVPQTEEARAEAACLMSVHSNFITPKCGDPLIVPIQDFLTASYLLTNKDRFFSKTDFMQTCSHFLDVKDRIKLCSPAILKPRSFWTGKQIMSVLLRPNGESKWAMINLEVPMKTYPVNPKNKSHPRKFLDLLDRYVVIRRSILVCGGLDKKILGTSKTGLFSFLIKTYGPEVAAVTMGRLSKLCSRWLGEFGFSIGIDDVTPSKRLSDQKEDLMDKGYESCAQIEELYRQDKLKPQPGCTKLETLEAKMLGTLSEIREKSGSICIDSLDYFKNSPIVMATCGSKGSTINIAQMIACVGQQALQSGRIPEGFVNRTLPHFKEFSRSPEAKGFVRNSFFTGLNATEFFFHTMAGREGLIDTAVKTADTGYMQRRLMKALEDGCVQYDKTVRNCENVVLQFSFGEDGLDPVEADKAQDDFFRIILRQCVNSESNRIGPKLLPEEIRCVTKTLLASLVRERDHASILNDLFKARIEHFIKAEIVRRVESTREKMDLPLGRRSEDFNKERFCSQTIGVTGETMEKFVKQCFQTYRSTFVEPGTAVGAIGAQSIGEPSTQMTLKTFHFAGVASMNITLGVPRIKEIINGVSTIKTPIINAALDCVDSEQVARIVKGRLEITRLGGVCRYIRQFICNDLAFVEIAIDKTTVSNLMLEINARKVKDSILRSKKLKLKENHVDIVDEFKLRITSPDTDRKSLLFSLERLSLLLPTIQVEGIENIHRAVIRHPDPIHYHWEYCLVDRRENGAAKKRWKKLEAKTSRAAEKGYKEQGKRVVLEIEKNIRLKLDFEEEQKVYKAHVVHEGNLGVELRRKKVEYELTVEGTDLLKTMITSGVDGLNTTTNLIPEVERVLGIEAAREAIARELMFTFSVHGLTVDIRHIMLLADVMTFKGQVLGITRFGISKMKDSVLMQASFETPMIHLFRASSEGAIDPVKGVSECIILGTTMPIGSGTFQLLRKVERFEAEEENDIFE